MKEPMNIDFYYDRYHHSIEVVRNKPFKGGGALYIKVEKTSPKGLAYDLVNSRIRIASPDFVNGFYLDNHFPDSGLETKMISRNIFEESRNIVAMTSDFYWHFASFCRLYLRNK